MKKTARNYLRLLRPRQWTKNFAIFAAITFGGQLFILNDFLTVTYGFVIFCVLSSAIYVINDIFDINKDRLHPFKRFRPLANGDIPIPTGIIIAIFLATAAILASTFISPAFFLITLIYFLLQILYSVLLKNIAVIDILALAGGYILRVYAGEFLSGYHISVWLLLTTISLSLFLAIGKRRRELTLVSEDTKNVALIRKTLSHYSERLLDVYTSIFATSTFISYSLFTFLENSHRFTITNDLLFPDFLPTSLNQRKWLMITIIPVVYGLMRYMQDIYEKHEGESPEKVLFSDKPLLATIFIWALLVIGIIYIIQA